VAHVHSAYVAHGHAGCGPCSRRWRGPCAQRVRGPRLRGARPSSASADAEGTTTHGDAARDGGATLSYGGDLTSAWETTGKAWQGSPARGRRRGTTRRRRWRRDAVSVDVGGHGGDGSDRATAAREARQGERLSGRRRVVSIAHLTR
jgi:hypothetical protein